MQLRQVIFVGILTLHASDGSAQNMQSQSAQYRVLRADPTDVSPENAVGALKVLIESGIADVAEDERDLLSAQPVSRQLKAKNRPGSNGGVRGGNPPRTPQALRGGSTRNGAGSSTKQILTRAYGPSTGSPNSYSSGWPKQNNGYNR